MFDILCVLDFVDGSCVIYVYSLVMLVKHAESQNHRLMYL